MDKGRILPDPSYPYGMRQGGLSYSNGVENKYLYNGKELQDDDLGGVKLDWYDYGARFYDACLGRWTTPDRLGELYYNFTTYSYVRNNPVLLIDPFGLADTVGTIENPIPIEPVYCYANNNKYNNDFNIQRQYNELLSKYDNKNKQKIDNTQKIGHFYKYYANQIRNSPFEVIKGTGIGPMKINPFFMAEAISGDLGFILVGAEGDIGGYFILAGDNAGNIIPYKEIAGGGAPEASISLEMARIDYLGKLPFQSSFLFGKRYKGWFGLDAVVGISAGISIGEIKGNNGYVLSTSISANFGASLFLFSIGYNEGRISKLINGK